MGRRLMNQFLIRRRETLTFKRRNRWRKNWTMVGRNICCHLRRCFYFNPSLLLLLTRRCHRLRSRSGCCHLPSHSDCRHPCCSSEQWVNYWCNSVDFSILASRVRIPCLLWENSSNGRALPFLSIFAPTLTRTKCDFPSVVWSYSSVIYWNWNVPSVRRNLIHPNNDHDKLRKDLPEKRVDIKNIVAKSYLPFRIYGTPFSNLSYGPRSWE